MTQWMYGKNVVRQILADQTTRVRQLWLAEKDPRILALAEKDHVPVRYVDKQQLSDRVGNSHHQNAAVEIEEYHTVDVQQLVHAADGRQNGLLIMLDELEDPHNLGAILRTADGAGADGVIFKKTGGVGLTPAVAKVSAGAIDTVPCACVTNLARTCDQLKKNGWWIVGTDMNGQDYRTADYERNIVLVIGNEGHGISRLVREKCDYVVSLPMRGRIQSLNASVSAGILMYEITSRHFPVN